MIIYQDSRYTLENDDRLTYLTADGKKYSISYHPYEPCTYIKDENGFTVCIHNAFNPDSVTYHFARGETVTSITGKVYTADEFCKVIDYAAHNCHDTDISYVEGALSVKRLIDIGATSPETAVNLEDIGVSSISYSFSHSKKLEKRVMYTEDGRAYVRIKK